MRFLIVFFTLSLTFNLTAQRKKSSKKTKAPTVEVNYHNFQWRNIGPFRGGRSVASTGVVQHPNVFYMGSTGGGVWKTTDAGESWNNISDGYFKTGTVGAIAVAESDPNVVVVGMGEHAARGVMTSMGDGVYISTDAGATWKHSGLSSSRHIANVVIHPTNPSIIYVAAQGAQFGPSEERGVFKSTDGGKTWKKMLYKGPTVGAASLSMDYTNPRILYASLWEHERTPWQMRSGGPQSGLYKSTDSGTTWTKMTKGLPKIMGKSGIDVSRANPQRLFANLEAEGEESGVYRSDNGGKTWKQVNKNRIAVARSWYYMEVFADPVDENTVYVLNAPALKSIDGGKTFTPMPTPHGDNHHLWIHPQNNKVMINSNDGGANVSMNGGKTWSTQRNQPTAQFYRVIADAQVPYHVYGGQQDNSAIGIKSRTYGRDINWKDWYSVAGCESAFLAFDPNNPTLVYGGCYQGIIERWQRTTGNSKAIKAYPELALGNVPRDFKYRFNWNAPILTDPKDPTVLFHAGNVVFKSTDQGQSWQVISPDLTKNEKDKQGPGGVPFTNEAAGGENYNTLMSLAIAPQDSNELWAGSDDGLLHLTRDGGKTWQNITPKKVTYGIINSIELSVHQPGKAYIVVMGYKSMDLTPYVYRTDDYGKNWEKITSGIQGAHNFVRVVRADKKVPGLLYAGTETGFYYSNNDGDSWTQLQLNLPVVPINDIYLQDNDLIAATAGRSFWILDDVAPLQQQVTTPQLALLSPKPSYRILSGRSNAKTPTTGQNPLPGVILDYYLPQDSTDSTAVRLSIYKGDQLLRSYSSKKPTAPTTWIGGPPKLPTLGSTKGYHRFNWDLRRAILPGVKDVFVYGSYAGGVVPPGEYRAVLTMRNQEATTTIKLLSDPNIETTAAAYQQQEAALLRIEGHLKSIHQTVGNIRKVQQQLQHHLTVLADFPQYQSLLTLGEGLQDRLKAWEQALIQPQQKTFQDVINFNNKLNAEFMHLKGYVDGAQPEVTAGALERLNDLEVLWEAEKAALNQLIAEDIAAFNSSFKELQIPSLLIME